jgi:hypothetical protein
MDFMHEHEKHMSKLAKNVHHRVLENHANKKHKGHEQKMHHHMMHDLSADLNAPERQGY